ncbi:bifunctional histidinol-phosphatase/imidazoleglycerol-phosphate dehydratase HisB [Alistipes sp. ZOR0009]|uniref:bifunctional histidinol-phosphatase/imidazoleglycerol-phosphate dehydratase HisB n=1 Tax=Alistipes sp. ZOR0009 TaxID=1339253 RepID=UPI000646E535|nr:bifunctional histidinol-phosphatase/imidazoleglycerol-phosphate dehydratase HisB [Alistipes sp. ZOR0009]
MSQKRKILFIDRDGTLINEPLDFQVDSLLKLKFYPNSISMLSRIAKELDYMLVMVTNQDGLGTNIYPQEAFDEVQTVLLEVFESVGVHFEAVHVDKTFPEDNSPNRKPNIGMLKRYLNGDFDIESSFVIGDRVTDVKMAKNIGCRAIWLNDESGLGTFELQHGVEELSSCIALETRSWEKVYEVLRFGLRQISIERTTKETDISLSLNIDGSGKGAIDTGIGFLNHMLELFVKHSGIDLLLTVKGDLHVDEHHTVEDSAIVLGEAFNRALAAKVGIERYAFMLPMDESSASILLDWGGRSHLEWDVVFRREKIGDLPTELIKHFFKSFVEGARCNLHIRANGENEHHIAEAIFKGLARTVKIAVRRDITQHNNDIPSTKGVI